VVKNSLSRIYSVNTRSNNEFGTGGGIGIGKRKCNATRIMSPVPLCSPQIPHIMTWD
jgi:hypothetical protein